MSRKYDIILKAPASTQYIEETLSSVLLKIAQIVGNDGIVLGHIKAIAQTEDGTLALSVTRVGSVDVKYLGKWSELGSAERFTASINVLSLLEPEEDITTLLNIEEQFA